MQVLATGRKDDRGLSQVKNSTEKWLPIKTTVEAVGETSMQEWSFARVSKEPVWPSIELICPFELVHLLKKNCGSPCPQLSTKDGDPFLHSFSPPLPRKIFSLELIGHKYCLVHYPLRMGYPWVVLVILRLWSPTSFVSQSKQEGFGFRWWLHRNHEIACVIDIWLTLGFHLHSKYFLRSVVFFRIQIASPYH